MSRDLPPVTKVTLEAALLEVGLRRREAAAHLMRVHRDAAFINRYAGIPVSDTIPPFTDDEMRELRVIPIDRVEAILERVLAAVTAVPAVTAPRRQPRRAYTRARAPAPVAGAQPGPAGDQAGPTGDVPPAGPASLAVAVTEEAVEEATAPGYEPLAEEPAAPDVPQEIVAAPVGTVPPAQATTPPSPPAGKPAEQVPEGNAAKVAKEVARILDGANGKAVSLDDILDMPTVFRELHYVGNTPREKSFELRTVLGAGVTDGRWIRDDSGYRTVGTSDEGSN